LFHKNQKILLSINVGPICDTTFRQCYNLTGTFFKLMNLSNVLRGFDIFCSCALRVIS